VSGLESPHWIRSDEAIVSNLLGSARECPRMRTCSFCFSFSSGFLKAGVCFTSDVGGCFLCDEAQVP
jgi:hypothetical protein